MFIQRLQIPSVPKKELRITLPYLGKMSQIVKTRLTKTMNKYMKFYKLRVIFQTNNTLKNYFRFKNSVPETLRSNVIYKFSCGSCTASCIGKTYRHFKVRVLEHQGVSPRTGKPVRGTLSTSVKDQMVACDYKVVHQNFKFFGKESNRYLLNLIEILSIKRGKPSLYKSLYCKSFYCFEYSIQDNFFLCNFAADIILINQRYIKIFYNRFLSHRVNGVNLKIEAVPPDSLFEK